MNQTRKATVETPLHWAAALNQPELVRALIDSGADVGAALHDDGKPLSDRLKQSMSEVGLDLNFSRRGYHPSHIAAFTDATEALTALSEAGAEINVKATNNGWTPLHAAASRNAQEVTAILIERSADINAKENYGWKPLHIAAYTSAGKITVILIERGADILAKDNDGKSPLEVATAQGSQAVVATLRKQLGDR